MISVRDMTLACYIALTSVGSYSPNTELSCGSTALATHPGEWKNWPEQGDRRRLCRSYLLDGSADILAQSLPFVLQHYVSILRYEAEPGVYDKDPDNDFEEDEEKATCRLAAEAEVHLEGTRPRILSKRRYVELLDLPLDKHSVSDLMSAEAGVLNTAAGCDDPKKFVRLIVLWSAYMNKLGAQTYVYYVLCELEDMARAWSEGNYEEQFKRRNLVLSTSAKAREPFQQYYKSVFSDPYLEKVSYSGVLFGI
jgi:hypothetical protein